MNYGKKTRKYLNQTSWFHGTSVSGYKSIEENGVKAFFNKNNELDFGAGFYLAPKKRMAEDFVRRILEFKSIAIPDVDVDDITPVVIEFEFPQKPMDYFEGDNYQTGLYESFDEEFARFIFHNRVHNVGDIPDHGYDLIYGVMSDSNPTKLIAQFRDGQITEEDFIREIMEQKISPRQLSIHNQDLCGILQVKEVHTLEHREVESV